MTEALETLLSIEEVAEYLGVSPRTIWEWKGTGYGPKRIRIGRRTWFRESDVQSWVANQDEVTA